VQEDDENLPIEKGGVGSRSIRGNKEMTDLLEVMKRDHEALVDQITIIKNRNDQLQKLADEKSNMFEDLKLTAEKAEHKYFTIK
jgi:hypothetical protein